MSPDGPASASFSPEELQRYHRQLILPSVGEEGQRRLRAARVVLVGAGGLGSPAALYLAAAGVGRLSIIDDDVVALSNLHRQVLHATRDVGRPKVDSAAERLRATNSEVQIATFHTRLTSDNALDLLRSHDVVLDGSDSFATRYLVNDACVLLGIPCVQGSVGRFDGQASVYATAEGPCYRCVFPDPPAPGSVPNCAEGGVLGVLPGLIGVIQATEALKLILGIGDTLVGRLLMVDALRMRFHTVSIQRRPECPACGTHEIQQLADVAEPSCETASSYADATSAHDDITPAQLRERHLRGDTPVLLDVREPYEWSIAHLEGARLVPLASLPHAIGTLDRNAETVIYCHHGMRSDAAAAWLRDHGFQRVRNLIGGIDRWSLEVDAMVRRY